MPDGTTLIILRHADRLGDDLSDKGHARAAALVGALDGVEIDAIYTLGIQRNLDTATPLAAARGLPVETIFGGNPTSRLMSEGAGETIVWVGNKDNLAAIWDSLSLPAPPPLEYGDLFFVEPTDGGPPSVERRRFEP